MAGDSGDSSNLSPEDFEKLLDGVMKKMLGNRIGPTSNNPAKYDRAERFSPGTKKDETGKEILDRQGNPIPVGDDEAYAAFLEYDHFLKESGAIFNDFKVSRMKAELARQKMFTRLSRRYPEVDKTHTSGGAGSGYRRYKGEMYYVGWDEKDDEETKE